MPGNELRDDFETIWEPVLERLRPALPPSTFKLWLDPLVPVSAQGTTLYVTAPDGVRAWVSRRYGPLLEGALRDAGSGLEHIVFVARDATPRADPEDDRGAPESMPLDSAHTFERFVIGSGNRLAHSAALAVAESPGEAYNPLFFHGPPGLGKTHLLGAIVDYYQRRRPELTVHYTTAERFTTDFVGALRRDGPERFKRRYRNLDALLIDDVQALEGKERTQEEFVHTFNALHAAGKQIVLSSDRPPDALARLAERLRDRFGWGLTVELGSPDVRTRTALLWRMASEGPLDLPEPTALLEIASRAGGNVRRLEGAMTRVMALSSMLSEPVTGGLVRKALDRGGPSPSSSSSGPVADPGEAPSVAAIQAAVCSVLQVSREDLLSSRRTAHVTRARQLAIYLARDLTSLSLAQIAREFNRDHSTVLHATRAVTARLDPDSETTALLHKARTLLTAEPIDLSPSPRSVHRIQESPPNPSTALNPDGKR